MVAHKTNPNSHLCNSKSRHGRLQCRLCRFPAHISLSIMNIFKTALVCAAVSLSPILQAAEVSPQSFTYTPRGAEVMMVLAGETDDTHGNGNSRARHGVTAEKVWRNGRQVCVNCGVIKTVTVRKVPADTSGLGAVTGAVVGGVLGNQVGGGNGKKLATVAGAVGGALAGGLVGNEIEKRNSDVQTVYDVDVMMDDGRQQSLRLGSPPAFQRGQKVLLDNGQLYRR